MSSWITIDRLGTKGMEPDLMPPHREPPSLDIGMNIRAVGPNLANAGGFAVVANSDFPEDVARVSCPNPVSDIGDRVYPAGAPADGFTSAKLVGNRSYAEITYARNIGLSSNGTNVFLDAEYKVADLLGNVINSQTVSINTGLDGTGDWNLGGNTTFESVANTTQTVICQVQPQQLCALVDYQAGIVTPWTYHLPLVQGMDNEGVPGKLKQLENHIYYAYNSVMYKYQASDGTELGTIPKAANFIVDDLAIRLFAISLQAGVSITLEEINIGAFTLSGTIWVTDLPYSGANDDHVYGLVLDKHYAFPPRNGAVTIRSIPIADGGGTGISQLVELPAGNGDRLVMRTGINTVVSSDQQACVAPSP